jgi:hypothetical protein
VDGLLPPVFVLASEDPPQPASASAQIPASAVALRTSGPRRLVSWSRVVMGPLGGVGRGCRASFWVLSLDSISLIISTDLVMLPRAM